MEGFCKCSTLTDSLNEYHVIEKKSQTAQTAEAKLTFSASAPSSLVSIGSGFSSCSINSAYLQNGNIK